MLAHWITMFHKAEYKQALIKYDIVGKPEPVIVSIISSIIMST